MLNDSEVKRLLDIANAGLHQGEVALARKIYEGILAGRPEHVPTLVSLALSDIAVGRYDEAQKRLREEVLAKHPDDPDGLVYLGLALRLAGRGEEARDVLTRVPEGTSARTLADALASEG